MPTKRKSSDKDEGSSSSSSASSSSSSGASSLSTTGDARGEVTRVLPASSKLAFLLRDCIGSLRTLIDIMEVHLAQACVRVQQHPDGTLALGVHTVTPCRTLALKVVYFPTEISVHPTLLPTTTSSTTSGVPHSLLRINLPMKQMKQALNKSFLGEGTGMSVILQLPHDSEVLQIAVSGASTVRTRNVFLQGNMEDRETEEQLDKSDAARDAEHHYDYVFQLSTNAVVAELKFITTALGMEHVRIEYGVHESGQHLMKLCSKTCAENGGSSLVFAAQQRELDAKAYGGSGDGGGAPHKPTVTFDCSEVEHGHMLELLGSGSGSPSHSPSRSAAPRETFTHKIKPQYFSAASMLRFLEKIKSPTFCLLMQKVSSAADADQSETCPCALVHHTSWVLFRLTLAPTINDSDDDNDAR